MDKTDRSLYLQLKNFRYFFQYFTSLRQYDKIELTNTRLCCHFTTIRMFQYTVEVSNSFIKLVFRRQRGDSFTAPGVSCG